MQKDHRLKKMCKQLLSFFYSTKSKEGEGRLKGAKFWSVRKRKLCTKAAATGEKATHRVFLSRCVYFSLFQIDFRKSAENYTKSITNWGKIHERHLGSLKNRYKNSMRVNSSCRTLLPCSSKIRILFQTEFLFSFLENTQTEKTREFSYLLNRSKETEFLIALSAKLQSIIWLHLR